MPANQECRDVLGLLERLAGARPGAPFLAVAAPSAGLAGAMSGAAFADRVLRLARGLCDAGFSEGDRLAVHLHRCTDEAVALLAAAVAGGIAVPLHPKLKDDQVRHVLADCAPWAVVGSRTKSALLADAPGVLGDHRVFAVGDAPRGVDARPLETLVAAAPAAFAPQAADRPAILLYTSGSTGLAKGVVQTHGNLAQGAAVVAGYLQLRGEDHVLGLLPLSFDYGLNQLLAAMYAGCRITLADFLALGELGVLLRSVRPTVLAGVPSLWHEVARGLREGTLAAADGSSLRVVTNSGGRWPRQDIRALRAAWPHTAGYSMYGLTEAFRSAYLEPAALDTHPDSFGKAVPGVELLLVDPETGAVLEGAATGELVHAGAFVAGGYWRNAAATARRFRPDPRPGRRGTVVYSGDLVRRDADGFHYFVGRRDRMLKVAGHRISPDEVAQALADVAEVGEVAVLGLRGEQGDEIVVCAAGDVGDAGLPQRLLRHCRARLPAYMVPARVVIRPALPHTSTGKIDLSQLERECAAEEQP